MADFDDFLGQLPYDSELLGVFHPLLGWRGRSGLGLQRRALVDRVSAVAARSFLAIPLAGRASFAPSEPTGNAVLDQLVNHVTVMHPGRTSLSDEEWLATLTPDVLRTAVQNATAALSPQDPAAGSSGAGGAPTLEAYYQATGSVVMAWLAEQPSVFNGFLLSPPPAVSVPDYVARVPRLADAVLSPLGLLHIFRQYFFELDSFLGSPVGHVWLPPGSTVELVEVSVRRRLVERAIESLLEITQRSETSVETKDELSEAVRQETADDMNIAASASGGFSVGVAHGEASASFHLANARRAAAEQTHRRARTQTERKSTEIRQSFKTTFRTVSEETDTTSKRYVLQNSTGELLNYELRRKMRRVAVQLQHLGSRLAWQLYLDNPATGLRISRLVHLARLSDADLGLRPPENTTLPDSYDEECVVLLPFHTLNYSALMHWDEDWVDGSADSGKKKIQWTVDGTRTPKTGFELVGGSFLELLPQGDLGGAPVLYAEPEVVRVDAAAGKFRVDFHKMNLHSAKGIRVKIRLRFGPTAETVKNAKDQFAKLQEEFDESRARAYQEAFVGAVRNRVKVAGEVRPRLFEDLREEERHCVFRRLVDTLTHGGTAADKHVAAEIVRQLFDIDSVCYFVAPDWWDPWARRSANLNVATPQVVPQSGAPLELTEADKLDWGQHYSSVGDPYLVTEESSPAPMGASLGWLLQLDGDRMRNAFLNAAWAKVVIPIRPRRERDAIAWLRDQAEQDVGLSDTYQVQPDDPPQWSGKTLQEVLDLLIEAIGDEHTAASTVDPQVEAMPGERVFEKGFDPLAGGVRFNADALEVFDQWVEVLPTDQVVAVEYPQP